MQLSFMTWACPDWTLTEVLTAALKYGYDSVEPRAECDQKHGVELEATKKDRKDIRARFEDMGIGMCCIATSCTYSDADPARRLESVDLTKRFVDLAKDVGCAHLRIFGGPTPEGANYPDVKKYVAEAVRAACEHAKGTGVYLCFETHDSYCSSADTLDVIRMVDHPSAAICWDVMHPFRVGDTIQQAFDNVKDHVRHCHVHDGIRNAAGDWDLALMGEGEIPHDEAFKLLAGIGFQGAMSGEWISYLPADEILPHDAAVMREYRKAAEG